MLIKVVYKNGKIGSVEDHQLAALIRSGKIKKFLRSEGWVVVGRGPVRESDKDFEGLDRRRTFKNG